MSDSNQTEQTTGANESNGERGGQSLQKLSNLQADIADLRHTVEHNSHDTTRKAKHLTRKNIKVVALSGIASLFAYFWFFEGISVPSWTRVVVLTTIAGSIVAYPYAKYVVDYLVKDTRKPVFAMDDKGNSGPSLYFVPEERIQDIQFIKGEPYTVDTKQGKGYEVQHFEVIEENGEQHLYAEGTWEGNYPASSVKANHSLIQSMREQLVPLAQYGKQVKIQWPSIMHKLESDVANQIVHEFQGLANHNGQEMQHEVDNMVDPEQQTNGMDESNYEKVKQSLRTEDK